MTFVRNAVIAALGCVLPAAEVFAQGGMQMPMPPGQTHEGHQMASMPENPLGVDHVRDGSGTSWLSDASPMQGVMTHQGRWMLMLHGNAFLQFIKTGSDRGDDQLGSIGWIMAMAQRPAGGGQLQFRAMASLEPLTVGRCGYPALVQSGEFCRGEPLHDRQHPHDLVMELALGYRRALTERVAFELYGGPAGEPALGPIAFPHRLSAMPNPIAPISHHWLDSSHITFGVVTAGVYGRRWKAEASIFNGREPDDERYGFDLAALDSYSGRLWFVPSSAWSFQISAGHLRQAEFRRTAPRQDVDRVTASMTYHRLVNNRVWATTAAWGRNAEPAHATSPGHDDGHATSAFAIETSADLTRSDTVFGRGEVTGKTTADLVLPVSGDEVVTLGKLQVGYTRWLREGRGVKAGIGGSAGVSILPDRIAPFYGSRSAGEFSVFFTLRPHSSR